jgi:catechol 2,3-dioxygenase-like lactoylglutathione lyase family enzyme
MKLEHVAINVEDVRAAAQWWVEHLGMKIIRSSDVPPYMTFIGDGAGSMVELYSNTDVTLPQYATTHPTNLHFAFYVEGSIEAKRNELVAAGATLVGDITQTPAGDQLLFLRDPWNVPLQLVKRKAPMA